jgi:hypothetical protein
MFVVLAVLISIVFGYRFVPYIGVVRITFDILIVPYEKGDYGVATFRGTDLEFSRYGPYSGSNQTTKTVSLPYGELHGPLNMSLNFTLQSSNCRVTLTTGNVTFSEEGVYTYVYFHVLAGVQPGTYAVNLAYTERFTRSIVHWSLADTFQVVVE